MMVGQDKVAVTVTTSIDFKQENREENLVEPVDKENMSGITISAQNITETYSGTGAAAGVPEAENPTDNLIDYVEGSNSNGDYERIEETINNEVNRIRKEIQESPYKIKNIGIQVMVEPPEENEDVVREEIERMLAAIVRTSLDSETAANLTDEQIANNIVVAMQTLNGSSSANAAVTQVIPWWLWVVGAILLASIALIVVYLMRTRKAKQEEEEQLIIEQQNELLVEDIKEEKETEATQRRKQLEKLAKEKPDDFAKLLRSWIAED